MRWTTSGFVAVALAAAPITVLAGPDRPDAQNVREDTVENQPAAGAQLGIVVHDLTREDRASYGAPVDRGLLVAQVAENSPAARAGLRVGDLVTAVRGVAIGRADDVIDVMSNLKHDETFSIDIVRDHKAMTLHAMLPAPPAPPRMPSRLPPT